MKKWSIAKLLFLIIIGQFPSSPIIAQDGGYTVTFVARGAQVTDLNAPTSFTGHAFIIIGVKTNFGVKEEIFGFYPTQGGTGLIKGPGMLKADHRCGPNDDCNPENKQKLRAQLSKAEQSVTVKVNEEQRRNIYKEINRWDSKSFIGPNDKQVVPSSDTEYRVTDQNCIDFVASVVKAIGYEAPTRSSLQTPTQFLKELGTSVEYQNKVRSAENAAKKSDQLAKAAEEKAQQKEREAEAANNRAADAEIRAADAEEKARQASDAARQTEQRRQALEQQTVPAGWIPCTCAHKHSALGKFVNGVLYHPRNINCSG
jgi:hypothetical protein